MRWWTGFRVFVFSVLIVGMAAGLTACGRKGLPHHPPDSDYPRQYPSP
ncbi:MAG: lipoprotein [Rhodospirillales bacterium]|nr:lipoprotein [Rhodospirillales bacterium]